MNCLFSKLKAQEHQVDVIKTLIGLFLRGLHKADVLPCTGLIDADIYGWFEAKFQEWVVSNLGNFFGKHVEKHVEKTIFSHGTIELKVWIFIWRATFIMLNFFF